MDANSINLYGGVLYYLLAVRQRARRPAAVPEPARN